MQKIVLLGVNISHSRSPSFLNPIFQRENLPWVYELMPVEREEIPEVIERMKRGGYRGANVTSPFKEDVLPSMDELSHVARRIGAVNTIRFKNGRAWGTNTDTVGFAGSLDDDPLLATPFTAAVIGTGGAARAAVDVLLGNRNLTRLQLISRDPNRAERELRRWGDHRTEPGSVADLLPADLIVHATPIGLPGRPGSVLGADQLRGCHLLYEMIYGPGDTELMQIAARQGIRTKNGGEMFEGQALAALDFWKAGEGMW